MKEASGEASLTVVAIILIGVIAAVVTPLVSNSMNTAAKRACCTNIGATWEGNKCSDQSAAYTSCLSDSGIK